MWPFRRKKTPDLLKSVTNTYHIRKKKQMKVLIIAEIPDDLGQPLCQHMRNFDIRHTGRCKFNVVAVAPDKSVDELSSMLGMTPAGGGGR